MAAPSAAPGPAAPALEVEWLGRVPYDEGLALQERAHAARRSGERGDRLLLLEHPPVVTLGRGAGTGHLVTPEPLLARSGIRVFRVGRGGDVTYHGPGQLVGYPVVDLRERFRPAAPDLHRYLRALEAGLVAALAALDLPARRIEGRTGVFVDRARSRRRTGPERKIASIGIGVRHWISVHGFALNVDLDLAGFRHIVPCGLHDVEMTSVALERGEGPATGLGARVREAVSRHVAREIEGLG